MLAALTRVDSHANPAFLLSLDYGICPQRLARAIILAIAWGGHARSKVSVLSLATHTMFRQASRNFVIESVEVELPGRGINHRSLAKHLF
jgi:hypothetical protein